ncbi:hypothetical protein C8J48_0129 [Desmospora activa DSM 45169]|uniref:Uncharacterized protein n=1 Tax=Desmospora activa DSM 45169 TaxID=1121389 RepID=A0A2T4Z6S7_9BACL|nr:hypothetical protein C8J48_0129 [Desmospora activa DSM 45169]
MALGCVAILIVLTIIVLLGGYFLFGDSIMEFGKGLIGQGGSNDSKGGAGQAGDAYNWKKDIPDSEENDTFQNFAHTGEDGNYEVTLDAHDRESLVSFVFHYDIIVADRKGIRTVSEKNVGTGSFGEEKEEVTVSVSMMSDDVPEQGLIKVAFYKPDGSERTEYLLETIE